MAETATISQMASDLREVKERVARIEAEIDELSKDLHILRPEYREKLRKLDTEAVKKLNSVEELDKSV